MKIKSRCTWSDAYANSRNFVFKDCDFFGSVLKAYNARVSSSSQNISNNDNIKFLDCNFAEEYDDPDPLIPLSSMSQGVEENVPQPQCLSGGTDYLISFGLTTRVRMVNCNITTNFTSKLVKLSADLGVQPTFNRNYLQDCIFSNYGYNGCNCDVDLTAIYNTDLKGPVRVLTIGITGINNEPTGVGCPDGSGGILHWYFQTIDQSSCSPNPIGNLWWTAYSLSVSTPAPKLIVPTSPNQEPLFWCTPCPYLIPSTYPQFCDFNSYKRKKTITNEEVLNTIKIFPNPAMEYFIIQNVIPGEQVKILNLLGGVMKYQTSNGSELKFDIKDFRPGIYFVQTNNNVIKLVKM